MNWIFIRLLLLVALVRIVRLVGGRLFLEDPGLVLVAVNDDDDVDDDDEYSDKL